MTCTVLTIAGSDSSGGAGIQADLKTMAAHKVYGESVVTALTAQNTTGVAAVWNVAPEFVAAQLDCVFTDIPPDAVKIGMVGTPEIVAVIAEKLRQYGARRVVVDPVTVATAGSRLTRADAVEALRRELFPLADVITPNIPEAEALSGCPVADADGMERAARAIAGGTRGAVLVKGGHLPGRADDLLWIGGRAVWFRAPRVDNPNAHGTGCTLSSAIACNLARGRSAEESARRAKAYVTGALRAGLNLGGGAGPLDHAWATPEIDFG